MVYFFTSNVVDPPATIYVGKDKFESPSFLVRLLHLLSSTQEAFDLITRRRRADQVWLGLRCLVRF